MSDEWGPWIKHDGKGCPCVGEYVHIIADNGDDQCGIPNHTCDAPEYGCFSTWIWDHYTTHPRVIRYRIRKPRGMVILEKLLADMPRVGEVEVI